MAIIDGTVQYDDSDRVAVTLRAISDVIALSMRIRRIESVSTEEFLLL